MKFLSSITKGKIKKPKLVLIYGTDGVGKSSFAAEAPAPIFLGPEDGTNNLDITRFPNITTWNDCLAAIEELATEQHDFKTLVVDSLDWLEPMLHSQICKDYSVKSIELAAGGYGKGYVEATNRWSRDFISRLNDIRQKKGMNVILIAHSDIVSFPDPQSQVEYKRFELKLHKKASALFREYVDAVLFANFEIFVKEENSQVKTFADGARIVHTERRPGFDAKNRYGLPFTLPLSWRDFEEAADKGQPESPEAILQKIEGLKSGISDQALLTKVNESLAKAGTDASALTAIANRLSVLVA